MKEIKKHNHELEKTNGGGYYYHNNEGKKVSVYHCSKCYTDFNKIDNKWEYWWYANDLNKGNCPSCYGKGTIS